MTFAITPATFDRVGTVVAASCANVWRTGWESRLNCAFVRVSRYRCAYVDCSATSAMANGCNERT